MVKISKKGKPSAIPVRRKIVKRRRLVPRMPAFDARYAELLANPCTGPLVHAPGSTEGGQVMRFEYDAIIGNGALETAGIIHWTPGAINASTSVNGFGLLDGVGPSDGTAMTIGNRGYAPGYAFLQTNASSYRCIAACVQLYFPGSEVNRAGVVSGAQSSYGLLSTTSYTPASIRSVSPVVERTPSDYMEVKWAPSYSDGLFRNPTSATAPEDGHSSLTVTWGGLPVATGMRVRLVAVYEWRAKTGGLVLSSNTSGTSAGAIQDIRRALDDRDANWWNKTGQAAVHFISGATVAYAARRRPGVPRIEL